MKKKKEKMKNDLIMDRNKQQLKNIFQDRIDELSDRVRTDKQNGGFIGNDVWNRQISLLYWVKEVLDNPKKWEVKDREQNLSDERVMDTEVRS